MMIVSRLSFFVFSTLVEVFLSWAVKKLFSAGLLHARGGVSACVYACMLYIKSSPRSWRCFLSNLYISANSPVFSTLVEVFLFIVNSFKFLDRLLHARGGVSGFVVLAVERKRSSPRSWRCF